MMEAATAPMDENTMVGALQCGRHVSLPIGIGCVAAMVGASMTFVHLATIAAAACLGIMGETGASTQHKRNKQSLTQNAPRLV